MAPGQPGLPGSPAYPGSLVTSSAGGMASGPMTMRHGSMAHPRFIGSESGNVGGASGSMDETSAVFAWLQEYTPTPRARDSTANEIAGDANIQRPRSVSLVVVPSQTQRLSVGMDMELESPPKSGSPAGGGSTRGGRLGRAAPQDGGAADAKASSRAGSLGRSVSLARPRTPPPTDDIVVRPFQSEHVSRRRNRIRAEQKMNRAEQNKSRTSFGEGRRLAIHAMQYNPYAA